MIALCIIGGTVAYLLIGAVVAGVGIRIDKNVKNEMEIVICLWPLLPLFGLFCAASSILVSLAKRIGGVK